VSYFGNAEDVYQELAATFELFLSEPAGREAALAASDGFDRGDGLPEEPIVVVMTSDPATSLMLILGENARVKRGGQDLAAQVQVTADASSLHDLLLENYDAGQIARAVEEKRIKVSGPPWSLDALIVLAGALEGFYRRSLEQRGRTDLLTTPAPPAAGIWEVPIPNPEDFMGAVVPARRRFNQTTTR
jgi:hypothetical protein